MLSLLLRQYAFDAKAFAQRNPHHWLVWEPGLWQTAPVDDEGNPTETRLPSGRRPDRPSRGDSLCFPLRLQKDAAVTLGRDPDNDIVINDATVSRRHCQFVKVGDVWELRRETDAMPVRVDDVPVVTGAVVSLGERHVLMLGDVSMTFHSPRSFLGRLAGLGLAA